MGKNNILYSGWEPEDEKLREALCTLGNGYFATRGASEESKDDGIHYPGTYLSGGYNRAQSIISGKSIENEDLVNFPNWLGLSFRPENGEWVDLEGMKVHDYEQNLDLKKGILLRDLVVEDQQGRKTQIRSRRLVSMRDMHNAAIHWSMTALNWDGKIEIRSQLDGTITNNGVDRYKDLANRHLDPVETRSTEKGILLAVQTKQSKLVMAQAARTRIFREGLDIQAEGKVTDKPLFIAQYFSLDIRNGQEVDVEKVVALYTSRDKAITEPALEAIDNISMAPDFNELLIRHEHAWEELWECADIHIYNGEKTQSLLRLHIFHILQTTSPISLGLDVGIPARGWHGEAYRGHIFWDELFISPFLNLRFPEISRSLLMYRFYRLDKARELALKGGYKGAMYPWQSGSNGREESQKMHLNPQSGNWLPDHTYLQYHVNSSIAYNIWQYFIATGDNQFLSFFGAEMFLSIALFWSSKSSYNKEKKRYEILHVVGPDEYHTSYPDSDQVGLNNNAYTNILAAWVMQKASTILGLLEKSNKIALLKKLDITEEEIKHWDTISTNLFVPFLEKNIISQFEGYGDLKEFQWEEYRKKYDNIQRLDRLLEKEGDSPNNYKASKQADVLMLFYLFSTEELMSILQKLGYQVDESILHKNVEYYLHRTSHGSTLSRLVFSWILSRFDEDESWKNFEALLSSDFEDIQGGTTPEGIHLGAMAGSLDLVQRCFCGIELTENALWIKPKMMNFLKEISFSIIYRGHWIGLYFSGDLIRVTFEEGWSSSVHIGIVDQLFELKKDEVKEYSLKG
jgi:trehalose/maltose hydrolase-like predicted phosphorylase